MVKPTLEDLNVYRRDAEVFEVHSWRTRGRCATVYKFSFSSHMSVEEFLIPSYMQGIRSDLILQAVEAFLEREKATAQQNNDMNGNKVGTWSMELPETESHDDEKTADRDSGG